MVVKKNEHIFIPPARTKLSKVANKLRPFMMAVAKLARLRRTGRSRPNAIINFVRQTNLGVTDTHTYTSMQIQSCSDTLKHI